MEKSRGGGGGMRTLLQNMSEKIKIFKRQLFIIVLQADKSLDPLPIILFRILHLQNYRVQKIKKGNNSKSILSFFIKVSPNILLTILYQLK